MKILMFVAIALISASPVLAQSAPEKTGVNSALGIAPKTQDFVMLAAQSDMLEIESSKLALRKSDSVKSKQFAERMIKDHTDTSTELRALVATEKVKATLPSALDKVHQQKLDKLAALDGKDFTREYNDMQVAAHKDAVSLFERYAKEGDSPPLQTFAATHLAHLREHLEMAQHLIKQ